MPDVAPRGEQPGQFCDITLLPPDQDGNGKERQLLTVSVRLEARDRQKNPFVVAKTYNLSGRGLTIFQEDFKSWSGRDLTNEKLDAFDPNALINNRQVVVKINHRKEGKTLAPVVEAFLPPPTPAAQAA